ncbi:hypothetical protein C6Y44_26555 (plasmid) [Rhodococcus rhodochrous]|nr:hypothetical protein C6Y44_26555 [Rhodococcus rhodochrous]
MDLQSEQAESWNVEAGASRDPLPASACKTSTSRKPRRRGMKIVRGGASAAVAALALSLTGGASVANAEDLNSIVCSEYMILGIPGSHQGGANTPDSDVPEDRYGPEVWQAVSTLVAELNERGVSADSTPLYYPAALDENELMAWARYDKSKYKPSKDQGYAAGYSTVKEWVEVCGSDTKIVLIGYSQGGHIAGDLAQTILHESKPFGQDNLGGVLLFGDPAFNGASPNTLGLDYRTPLDDGEPYTALSLEKTAVMEGSLGQRAEFDENAPVLSVCLHGDLICDLTAESAAAGPTTHQAYTAKFAEASTPMSAAEWSALVLHDIIENGEK